MAKQSARRVRACGIAGLALASGLATAAQAAASSDPGAILGVWRNPKNSVHVDIRPCGAKVCGVVVWASPKAKADAKRGAGQELVGQQLLRDFERQKNGAWRGRVWVPDINKTFTGTALMTNPDTLQAKGCVMGLFCKSQVWRRVEPGAG